MPLPPITLYVGRDRDFTLRAPASAGFNFDDYDESTFVCGELGFEKSTADANEAVTGNGGLDLTVKQRKADVVGKALGRYRYQLKVTDGPLDIDVAGEGLLILAPSADPAP